MSNDAEAAAAFFAKKKGKKKKKFTFNANKVDISQITSSTHVDAPEVSTEGVASTTAATASMSISPGGGDWGDEKETIPSPQEINSTSETNIGEKLLDMKTAYESKRNEKEEIKEKLRVEETKAQLAAARDGMKKQEEKKKEEKETKKKVGEDGFTTVPKTGGNRFGLAAGNMAGGGSSIGSKWVPPHMRGSSSGPSAIGGRSMGMGMGGSGLRSGGPTGFQKQVNTNDEELFPDLATADKIIAKEEEQKAAAAAAASRRSKPSVSPWGKKKVVSEKKEVEATPVVAAAVDEKKADEPAPTPAPKPVSATPVAAGLKKKKKKKKDLSTFKA